MDTKTCTKCGETKPISEFNKRSSASDGLSPHCRVCKAEYDRQYRLNNPEKVKAGKARAYQANKKHYDQKTREWVKNNPDRRKEIVKSSYEKHRESKLEYSRNYRANNKEVCAQRVKDWEKRNKDRCRAKYSRRRTAKLKAIPSWLTNEQKQEIDLIYSHARDCEIVSGEKYHVDHIIPLQGKNVCGLHVPWNLQVLPADLNFSKGNRFDAEAEQTLERHSCNG